MADIAGKLVRISGPMIAADGMLGVTMVEAETTPSPGS